MISFLKAYSTEDGKVFPSIEEAQNHEIACLLKDEGIASSDALTALISYLVQHKDKIIDILTTTGSSRPKARKINGGTKKRTPKTVNEGQAQSPT